MAKELKRLIVEEYKQAFKDRDSLLFVDYQNVSIDELNALRTFLREHDLQLVVVKNTLMSHALTDAGVEGFNTIIDGPVAVVLGEQEGAAQAAARVLADWHKKGNKSGAIKGGLLEGHLDDADAAAKYKDLPTRAEMLSQLVGQILGVGARLASQLLAPGGAVASQIAKKGEEGGDA